jgi:carboxylate-amine ligase
MKRLYFKENGSSLTLGVELELQVLDKDSLLLSPRAHEILEKISNDKLKHEFFQSTLEVTTGICSDVHQVCEDLRESLIAISGAASELGLKISSTGTHPEADYRERLITPSPRYHELLDRNQWIIRRMAVYGMHIHIGMESGEECIRFHNFFLNFIPHLLALSASSPFWQKNYTGLACSRPIMYESMPTAGMPHMISTWTEFEEMFNSMIETKSVNGIRDLWLDLRPSPELGTLEIRVCDEQATLSEVLAIASYVHALAYWYKVNYAEWDSLNKMIPSWAIRENKWRSIRYGLSAELIKSPSNETIGIKDDIVRWLKILHPIMKKKKYDEYFKNVWKIIDNGNSAERQLKVFSKTSNLHEVIKHNVKEFELMEPQW